jgi:hypothetical protein
MLWRSIFFDRRLKIVVVADSFEYLRSLWTASPLHQILTASWASEKGTFTAERGEEKANEGTLQFANIDLIPLATKRATSSGS